MKFNFKKIASVFAGTVLMSSTLAFAAAANYPAPFVQNGQSDVYVVYGSQPGAEFDLVAVADITTNLQAALAKQTASSSGSSGTSARGTNYVQLDKTTDRINLGNTLSGPFGSTIKEDEMSELLADGTYTAEDNDEFKYEQKIELGTPTFSHFRNSDYESLVGLSERTPVLGFNMGSDVYVMNYTLDFIDQAETDITSGDLEDIEGSDVPLLGKMYYVSDAKNGTSATTFGKWTLLDSAVTSTVKEGETKTVVVGDASYDVSIAFIDSDSAVLNVNGKETKDNAAGASEKLADGSYVGIRSVRKLAVSGEIGSVEFSIGKGKLEIDSGNDIKLNDKAISGVKGYIFRGTTGTTQKVDKIVLEWKTDDDTFLTKDAELVLPGFESIKLSMNDLVRGEEEKLTIEKDSDTSLRLKAPIKDGTADFNLLYGNGTAFQGLGKSATERLATGTTNVTYRNKVASNNFHKWLVVSYNTTTASESYLLSFDVTEDTSDGRNETTIKNEITKDTWEGRSTGQFTLGDVSINIDGIHKNGSDEWVLISGGSNVNFNTLFTKNGLKVYLPLLTYEELNNNIRINGAPTRAMINLSHSSHSTTAGYSGASYYFFMKGEDKDGNLDSGNEFNFTLDQTSSGKYEVTQVEAASNGGSAGLEVGDSTSIYETYIVDDVTPRTLHYTKPDEDYAEVYYPSATQTYAEVFLSAVGADLSGVASSAGSTSGTVKELGSVLVRDNEVASLPARNLIVVGGSCVNSIANELLGSAGCGADFTAKTGVGAGQFLVQSFSRANGKVATLVAGYHAADTQNAAKVLVTKTDIDTTAGKKYVSTSATTVELSTTDATAGTA